MRPSRSAPTPWAKRCSHIQSHVRDILKQLRPDGLAETGLAVAIGNLATFWQRSWRHRDPSGYRGAKCFGAETDAVIYRLVQEGLTNAARHGAASQAWIAHHRRRMAQSALWSRMMALGLAEARAAAGWA